MASMPPAVAPMTTPSGPAAPAAASAPAPAAKPQPTVKPSFSFAAAILKGNSAPVVVAPVVKRAAPVAAAPAAAATAAAPAAVKKPKAAKPVVEKKEIPLTAGSAWAQKLQVSNAPMKPLAVAAPVPAAATPAAKPQPKAETPAAESPAPSTTAPVTAAATVIVTPESVAPVVVIAAAAPVVVASPAVTTPAATIATPAPVTAHVAAATPTVAPPTSFAAALRAKLAPSTVAPVTAASAATPITSTPASAPKAAKAASTSTAPLSATGVAVPVTRKEKKGAAAAIKAKAPQVKAAASTPAPSTSTPAAVPAPTPVAAIITAPAAVVPATTTAPSAAMNTKFGLVPVEKKFNGKQHNGPMSADRVRHTNGAPRRFEEAQLPENYTLFPLSPYQLFLLDPRTNVVAPSISALNNSTGQIEELSGCAADCVPLILMPSRGVGAASGAGELLALCDLIAYQLNWYFSVDNLVRDQFLRGRMGPRGYIALQDLLTFPRIRQLTSSAYYLGIAARYCMQAPAVPLDVDTANTTAPAATPAAAPKPLFKIKHGQLRLRSDWQKWVFPRPADNGESSEEEDETEDIDASIAATSENTPSSLSSRSASPLATVVV